MKRTNNYFYEMHEEIRSYHYDNAYDTYESSYTSRYDRVSCYDTFTGISDDLFDEMQMSFALNVNVVRF